MHEAVVSNPSGLKEWDELLCHTAGHSFFHTAAWAKVLQESYRYQPVYFTTWEQVAMKALLPVMEVNSLLTGKRGVSLPFTDYCEPAVSDAAQFRELFAAAVAFGANHQWQYLEIRGGEPFFPNEEPSECHYGHTVDLTEGARKLFAGLRDSNRRNIKKAEKGNIDVAISAAPDAVKAFCRLNALTRRDHGLPPQPDRFFQCVYDHILSQGMGFIILASFHGTAIAANLYFTFGDQIIYKYGASDRTYQHLRASNLVMWEAIKWGCDHGYRTLCFGRTEPENEGLRQFKAGWGAQERLIRYYRYDLQKRAFIKTAARVKPSYQRIFGKLPIPLLKMFGTLLYRHMG